MVLLPWRYRKCKHILTRPTDGLYDMPHVRVSWQYPSLRVVCPNCGAENVWRWPPWAKRPPPEKEG